MKHIFLTAEDISEGDSWGQLNILDGGLGVCKVCGGMEGSLTTDCCGERIHFETDQEVYAGKIDFRKGEGWVSKPNPTNQMWQKAAELRKAWGVGEAI